MSLSCRCIIQLTLLGYILVPIFTYNQWWLVLLYACFMLYVGCLEASQRPAYSYAVSALPASFADVTLGREDILRMLTDEQLIPSPV